METFSSKQQYHETLFKRSVLPEGFRAGAASLTFRPGEKSSADPYKMNISAIVPDKPTKAFGAVFTRNEFPGIPVILGRELAAREYCRGIVSNNRIANVCASGGREKALKVLGAFSEYNGGSAEDYFAASTGVIGWELPADDICAAVPDLAKSLQPDSIFPVAQAIMTTDNFAKVRSAQAGDSLITGTAKGAGMIEPDMATMFSFLLSDADISREQIRKILPAVVSETFNRISVDSDQSTSDMVICLVSGRKKTDIRLFEEKLFEVCSGLAEDIVRNGEGTAHVIRLAVSGAPDKELAVSAGKSIINSPLVKTAVFGNDPNVGRIVMAIGDWAGKNGIKLDTAKVIIQLGPETVFRNGVFHLDNNKEKQLSQYLRGRMLTAGPTGFPEHDQNVELKIELGSGSAEAAVIGSDLSYEYVRENAEYTS